MPFGSRTPCRGRAPNHRPIYGTQARLTILRQSSSPDPRISASDPQTIALGALGWLLAEEARAERLLSLTGLTPENLRASLGDDATLGAVLDFLCAHQPDLCAAADALGIEPQHIVAARERLAS